MKKIKFCACGMAIAISATLFAKANLEIPNQRDALLISNIEALCESFEWGGYSWNTTDKHSWGTDWKPVMEECAIWDHIYINDNSYPVYIGQGYKVNCKNGNGDCLFGTLFCSSS